MKTRRQILKAIFVLLPLAGLSGLNGCASWDASNTESLLSAAGFRTRTPSTPEQEKMFARLTPYQVERRERNGKVLYTYADTQRRLVYVGGEAEFQRFKQLGLQQAIAEERLQAAQINEDAALYSWGPNWGPWNIWW
ncbi:MAG: hypothetical protein JO333_17365 [Verrucomicrobia bacterium]|nr:hypothetical protein [Verrucomicrobiota bacterium]